MRKKIPFAGPSITQKEIDYVTDGVKMDFTIRLICMLKN